MLEAALLVLFPLLMAYAASSDLLTMTIPNRLALILVASFPVMAWAVGMDPAAMLMNLAAAGIVLALTFSFFAFGWMGGGDAKLAGASALWLGFGVLLDYLLLAAVAGGVLTVALLAIRRYPLPAFALGWPWLARLHHPKTGIPYGIALAAAALAVYPYSAIWTAALAA
ncbi:prepilin peptidase [Enterovirga sp.]|uniref:A24 family peptidase n=1 Tax=Enterovirga sp. TaxID=2026350 RepID=UPI002BF99B26|nr:prepilin peptidase [Enterovirga sp.]HMO29225.1 prepilin peptidase [Enterovirga sp.]